MRIQATKPATMGALTWALAVLVGCAPGWVENGIERDLDGQAGVGGGAGTGGVAATGGNAGAGGHAGAGGDAGTGGHMGAGGVAGTGGHVGAGGVAGTGGHVGAGGDAGAGGHAGAGGDAGAGGHAGAGGDAGTGGHAGAGGDAGTGGHAGAGGDAGAGGSTGSAGGGGSIGHGGYGGSGGSGGPSGVQIAVYRDDKPSAYSMTFDDDLWSQYEIVFPLLESYGYKATFFIVVGRVCSADDPYCYRPQWRHWREIHDAGHEIGNHSMTHWFQDPDTTLEENIVGAADLLAANLAAPLTFAYPGSSREGSAAEIAYMDSLVLSRHLAWRRGNDKQGTIVNRSYINFGSGCDADMNGAFDDLLAHVDGGWPAYQPTTWLIGLWHGVDEGYCPVSSSEIADHMQYVSQFESEVWIAPFSDVVRYEIERQSTAVVVHDAGATSITFSGSNDLDQRFDVPLTYIVDPQNPFVATAHAAWEGGGAVEARIDAGGILVTAVPSETPIVVSWD